MSKRKGGGKKPGKGGKGKSAIAKLAKARVAEVEELENQLQGEKDRVEVEQWMEDFLLLVMKKVVQDEKDRIAREKEEEKERLKAAGLYETKGQRQRRLAMEKKREQMIAAGQLPTTDENQPKPAGLASGKTNRKKPKRTSGINIEIKDEPEEVEAPLEEVKAEPKEEDSDEDWENDAETETQEEDVVCSPTKQPKNIKEKKMTIEDQIEEAIAANPLKSPVICIMGHVDTGKTKLLDKIRHTNVQLGEAGGITQQIGATFFPQEALQEQVDKLSGHVELSVDVPGVLIIDTPGHESFQNLRSRGSSLCDLAILVVDIMHGLENQTIESLNMIIKRRIPFVVALNKIDRMYGWDPSEYDSYRRTIQNQTRHAQDELQKRIQETILEFANLGHNAALYTENEDPDFIDLVPTSAHSGEGIPDLLTRLVQISQTHLRERITFQRELAATVMEVKNIEGLGTTVDVIIANGVIRENDRIVLAGINGPIDTRIRALLSPQPLRELRVKAEYIHHKFVRASLGVKISGQNLETALAGSQLRVVEDEEDLEDIMEEVQADIKSVLEKYIDEEGDGVYVMASTVGSLEALLEYLKDEKVKVSGVNIGKINKKDVIKAQGQLEKNGKEEYATILAFDIKATNESRQYAEEVGVHIIEADIIYHLTDMFSKYLEGIVKRRKQDSEMGRKAVFPCVLQIAQGCVFHASHPIIIGVDVLDGILRVGTPLCIPGKQNLIIGKVKSLENNGKPVQEQRSGSVAVAIEPMNSDQTSITVGRHFDEKDQIASWLTRKSIDALKEYFKDEMTKEDWKLVIALKKQYAIA